MSGRQDGTPDAKAVGAGADDPDAKFRPQRSATQQVSATLGVAQSLMASENGDEGIARLAHSVHSGRTGRYGEVFQSVETTMTWGKGLSAEDIAAKREHEEAYAKRHGTNVETSELHSHEGQPSDERAAQPQQGGADDSRVAPPAPPSPPAPPMPPAVDGEAAAQRVQETPEVQDTSDTPDTSDTDGKESQQS